MKYLPFENIQYKSKLTKIEILNRLSNITEQTKFDKDDKSKTYKGKISENEFEIERKIKNRNSFLPLIKGLIKNESIIEVKMRLNLFVMIFVSYFIVGSLFGILFVLFNSYQYNQFNMAIFMPFGMLLFTYALVMIGFKSESKKSIKGLQTLFEAEIIQKPK